MEKLSTERNRILRNMAMMFLDSPVSVSIGLGYALSHQTIGGMMTCSSFIQCMNLWPAKQV